LIYIWIRSTAHWEDEEAVLAQLSPELRSKVAVWNETFTMPFHVFRHRVREIARLNVSRVENAACASWEGIPAGSLVVPADDDDWFAPDLGRSLQDAYDPGASGYHWSPSFIEVPINLGHRVDLIRRRMFPRTPAKWLCATNSYALYKGPETERLLRSHTSASRWFEAQPDGRVRRLARRLSAMNRTLGSQTSLGWQRSSITRSQLIRKLRSYRALYRKLDPPELAWCRPYLAMMADLMDRLGVKDPPPRLRGARRTLRELSS
jgi:hypothetical protein